jgi:hypothetical protein
VEVCNRGMVASMLTVYLSSIFKLSLQSFSQNWIKRFILTRAYVHSAQGKSNNQFQSLKVIISLCSLLQVFWTKGPDVNNSLDCGLWLEDLNRQADMGYGQPLKEVDSQLLNNIN